MASSLSPTSARPPKPDMTAKRAQSCQALRVPAPPHFRRKTPRPLRPPRAAWRSDSGAERDDHSPDDDNSAESEYESLAAELAPLIDPDRIQRAANQLELAWDISRVGAL
mmetsp:Transcript_42112/g.105638  ORF Transcript_42112/g.105638 Transcript_42112/m.105638 type:complete len:110 (-) Transcript_42112:647-976(-)